MDAVDQAREYLDAKHRIYCKLEIRRIIDGLLAVIEPPCPACNGLGMIDGVIVCPDCAKSPQDVLEAVRAAHHMMVGEK